MLVLVQGRRIELPALWHLRVDVTVEAMFMWEKINRILNIAMGSCVGVFIGRSGDVFWEYKAYPNLYAMQSAPWYTSIFVNGIFTVVVLIVAVIIKLIIRKVCKYNQ